MSENDINIDSISLEHKLWFTHNWLFHVSDQNVKTLHLTPRQFSWEPGPDRICFSHSITNCLKARMTVERMSKPSEKQLYVYGLDLSKWSTQDRSKYIRRPNRKFADFALTQEMWVLKPVDIPQIMIIAPSGGDSTKLTREEYFKKEHLQNGRVIGLNQELLTKLREKGLSDNQIKKKYHLTYKENINKYKNKDENLSEIFKREYGKSVVAVGHPLTYHKWRIIKVTADPSVIGQNLYNKLVHVKENAPWNNPLMKAYKQHMASKESLLNDYEEMENLFSLTDQIVEYGENLVNAFDNIQIVYECMKRESSNEGLLFLDQLISFEANATPATGAGTGTAKKSAVLSNAVMNAKSVMGRMKEFMGRAGSWIQNFFGKSVAMSNNFVVKLQQKLTDLQKNNSNLNFKFKNICPAEAINNAKLNAALARVNTANDRDTVLQVFNNVKQQTEGLIKKEEVTMDKNGVANLIAAYIAANQSIASARDSALRDFAANQDKAKNAPKKWIKNNNGQTASINIANYLVRFIFRNTLKILGSTAKNIATNG